MKVKFADLVLIIIFTTISLIFVLYNFKVNKSEAKYVHIGIEGLSYIYPIAENFTKKFKSKSGFVEVFCRDGEVSIIDSSCRDKICQKDKIRRVGQSLICLPNATIVTISGDEDSIATNEVDDVSF